MSENVVIGNITFGRGIEFPSSHNNLSIAPSTEDLINRLVIQAKVENKRLEDLLSEINKKWKVWDA